MENERLIQFITQVLPVSEATATTIASHFEPLQIQKNEFLLREGQMNDRYFFVADGFLRAFTYDTEGNDITTGFYTPNQMAFEVSSFFLREPSKENIRALSDCSGSYITYGQLQVLFHTIPEFREFGRAILVRGFIAFKQRTLSLIRETAETRYANLLQARPEIVQHVPLKYIASYLGMTDTSLSRIRAQK